MQHMFEQNLRRFCQAPDSEEVKGAPGEGTGKYKIDLLDGNDEEDFGDLSVLDGGGDMDEDEKEVEQGLRQNKFESLFGLGGEEGVASSHLRESRDWRSKNANSRIRSSIAGKFFQQREDGMSQVAERLQETPKLGSDPARGGSELTPDLSKLGVSPSPHKIAIKNKDESIKSLMTELASPESQATAPPTKEPIF